MVDPSLGDQLDDAVWRSAVERLQRRFPGVAPERLANSLRRAGLGDERQVTPQTWDPVIKRGEPAQPCWIAPTISFYERGKPGHVPGMEVSPSCSTKASSLAVSPCERFSFDSACRSADISEDEMTTLRETVNRLKSALVSCQSDAAYRDSRLEELERANEENDLEISDENKMLRTQLAVAREALASEAKQASISAIELRVVREELAERDRQRAIILDQARLNSLKYASFESSQKPSAGCERTSAEEMSRSVAEPTAPQAEALRFCKSVPEVPKCFHIEEPKLSKPPAVEAQKFGRAPVELYDVPEVAVLKTRKEPQASRSESSEVPKLRRQLQAVRSSSRSVPMSQLILRRKRVSQLAA